MERFCIFLILFIFCFSCEGETSLSNNTNYNLENPAEIFPLPPYLKEVSGITTVGQDLVVLIEDNTGYLFFYDLNKKDIIKSVEAAGRGDFEDVVLVNNTYFLLRSDGTLFTFTSGRTSRIKTPLGNDHDAEGLAYDKKKHRILVALKGDPLNSKKKTDREIYGYDLNENKFITEPVITISLSDFEDYTGKKAGNFPFKPSGIAVGPDKESFYIISSTADMIVKISREGNILEMAWLDERVLEQPEGIAFSEEGSLFITSEGKAREPRIVKFEIKE